MSVDIYKLYAVDILHSKAYRQVLRQLMNDCISESTELSCVVISCSVLDTQAGSTKGSLKNINMGSRPMTTFCYCCLGLFLFLKRQLTNFLASDFDM